jgi:3',5'-cyclic-AMP phosphodiesterase
VLCGHYHMNDEQKFKNIKQFTTQSLSFQLIKKSEEIKIDNRSFGYRIIEIYERKIKTQLINFTF